MSTAADAPGSPELDHVRERARELAEGVDEDSLAREPLEAILERLVTQGGPQLVALDLADRHYTPKGNSITLTYPLTGPGNALMGLTPFPISAGTHGSAGDVTVQFRIMEPDPENLAEELERAVRDVDEKVLDAVAIANMRLEREQEAFTLTARESLERRWTLVRTLRGAMERLDIPLGPRTTPLVDVPVRPSPLSLKVIEQAAVSGAPQYVLADDMAESVVSTVASFALALERLPVTAAKLVGEDEESLRDVLLFVLNANFGGLITGETFIRHGKADLLLRWKDRDAFVGECKIWKGQKALTEGLDQLLDGYTLWRQSRIALVVFIRASKDATQIIEKARHAIAAHPRVRREIEATEPARRSDFEVLASGDEKRLARLTLLPVVIS